MKKLSKEDKEIILEQYKLYVGTAEKVSDMRQTANTFFLTINSVLLTYTGYLTTTSTELWYFVVALTGILISYFWREIIKSYRQLNSSKFHIIHDIEKKLPIALFTDEWEYLGRGKNKDYSKLTVVESKIPLVFIVLYVAIIILMLI